MILYIKTIDCSWFKQRLHIAMAIMVIAFIALILRLSYLQIIEGEEYRRLSESNRLRIQSLDPPRGLIIDAQGQILVKNRPAFDLKISARHDASTLEKISELTGMSIEYLRERVNKNGEKDPLKPILLKEDIDRNMAAIIEVNQFNLSGVILDVVARRHYIHGLSASHLIGYLGEIGSNELKSGKYPDYRMGDFIGKYGIEKLYDKILRGNRGGAQVEVNSMGKLTRVISKAEGSPGDHIHLTIHIGLQKKAEELMGNRTGAVVAMNPENGDVLALVSSPSFDPNSFVNRISLKEWTSLISNPFKPMTNRAVCGEYPPASTFKIVTALAGLIEGVITPRTTFYCPGNYKFGDRVFRCWKKEGHGSMNVRKALSESCDVFFYQVGERLGVDKLAEYSRRCGLGKATGIEFEHESVGLVPTSEWKKKYTGESWQPGETLPVAIGQGYDLATPIQIAALVSAVANGGTLYQPMIIKTIESVQGETIFESKAKINGILPGKDSELFELVRKGLWDVVNSPRGTARLAQLENIQVSGKTGTAQVVSRHGETSRDESTLPNHLKPHAWFAAYATADNADHSEIAVVVLVENGEKGSTAAAPIARDLIKFYYDNKS